MTDPRTRHLCPYCGGTFVATAAGAACNPFCNGCLPERLEAARRDLPPTRIEHRGDYIHFEQETPTHD